MVECGCQKIIVKKQESRPACSQVPQSSRAVNLTQLDEKIESRSVRYWWRASEKAESSAGREQQQQHWM